MGNFLDKEGLDTALGLVKTWTRKELADKAGVFYMDNVSGSVLVFANDEGKAAYLADQSKTELLLGVIPGGGGGGGATGEYRVAYNLLTPMYNAVSLGSKGHYIRFTFEVLNDSGMPTGEPVIVTYKVTRGGTSTEYKEVYRYGSNVAFNVDKYISEGSNTITVHIMGQTSLVSTTFAITFDVINLTLKDYLDISKVYNLSNNGTAYMEVPYEVSGTYTKLMEWYIDGELLEFNRTDDEILETVPVSRTKTIELSNLSQGRHNIQFRVGSKINGEMFYSDTLYRDFFVYTGVNDDLMLGVAVSVPSEYGILDTGLVIYDMAQYVGYTLQVASYSPINTARTDISISLDEDLVGTITSRNGLVTNFTVVSTTDGHKTLRLAAGEIEYNFPVEVAATDMNISEITSGLKLNFNARGRNNNSSDRDTWTDGTTTATLTGFQWNNRSGWVNDRLEISEGAELHIPYAPLASHDNGKTIEIEWNSKNVSNEDEVLCDLRNDNGTGILITASAVVVTSANNVSIERRYKSEENARLSVVINPNRGTNKGLTLIYINGVVSGAVNVVEGDDYISDKEIIFRGSSGANVSLKQLMVYDTALSTEQEFNNFTLYRDTVSEMLDVYNRNSIYDGSLYDTSKMARRLPVMIVTGEIPTLENTNDKDTQIIVDIEYINMQDTSRSFTMKNAAMRPQGTSSMGYPKKNFRIYTNKIDSTELVVNGKEVADKLYSFKDKAIPVDCWCLKADYAESSGTHNVGVARMWGDAFKNAQVTVDLGADNPHNLNNAYALRTTAQQKAIDNGYKYDVRTTIDGFPILLFYRRTPESDIIFLGKYNFNNDKSTEKVFGFTDIPGFDNTRMQCWELLNNGNPIGLFTDVSDFYKDVEVDGKVMKGWQAAFESRYPDTKTPKTDDLFSFASWVNSVDGNAEKFGTEKWEHLDVYKVAGYYCYLNRHGAADQFVKNAMLTSEDGEHFYFILYDNDTINGLNNTGAIAILPTDTRESVYADGSHKFAGYDSVLWNMLEGDEEFMEVVRAVDNALYSAGVSYANAIKGFDDQQADKWVERIYNLDAEYKYISPYTNSGTNNLFMLQGKRDIHRRWFLANRYSLYDSLFVSGAYKSGYVEIKCVDETMPTQRFSVKSGYPIYYGYGINGKLRQRTETPLEPNEAFTFEITEKVNLGDPIAVYGAPHIKELDLSTMSDRISVLQLAGVYEEALGTKLEVLKIGSSLKENVTLKEISGIKNAKALTHLDVTNMKGLTAVDLSESVYLKEFIAAGTNIASATFAAGAPIEHLVLPQTFRAVRLTSLPALSSEGLELADVTNVESFVISECPNLSNDFSWVYAWYQNKKASNENTVLHMDNVDWTDVDPDELVEIVNIGNLKLKGHVRINRGSQEIVDQLKEVFGETVFNKTSEFYVMAPDGVYLSGPSKLLEGESARYVVAAFSEENGRIQFSLMTSRQGCSIDATSGRLTTTENGLATSDIVVRAVFITDSGKAVDTVMTVTVEKRAYPTSVNITGGVLMSEDTQEYALETTPEEVTGNYTVSWTLSEGAEETVEIDGHDNKKCVLRRIKSDVVEFTLTATLVKNVDGSTVATGTKTITSVLPGVVITRSSNAPLQECLYNAGLVAHEGYSEAWELALITADQLQPGTSWSTSIFYNYAGSVNSITSLMELEYFTGLETINSETFRGLRLGEIYLPKNLKRTGSNAFSYNHGIKVHVESFLHYLSIEFGSSANPLSYANNAGLYVNGEVVKEAIVPEGVTTVYTWTFYRVTCFDKLVLPTSVVLKGNNILYYSTFKEVEIHCDCKAAGSYSNSTFLGTIVEKIIVGPEVTEIGSYFFNRCKCPKIIFSDGIEKIGESAFNGCEDITELDIPGSVSLIYREVFSGCKNLERIRFHSPTLSIGYFDSCPNLKEIHVDELSHWLNYDLTGGDRRLLAITDDVGLYANGELVEGVVTIPQTVEKIKQYAFYGYKRLTGLHITSNVSQVSPLAFSKVPLETITVDEDNAFLDSRDSCNAVITKENNTLVLGCGKSTIPSGVINIDYKAFEYVTFSEGYTDLVIPESVVQVGTEAFSNTNITSLEWHGNGVNMGIGTEAFSYCASLLSVDIMGDFKYSPSPYFQFYKCGALKTVKTSATGDSMFSDCPLLEDVELYEGVKVIAKKMLNGKSNLTNVTLPTSVTSILESAFQGCSSMKGDFLLPNVKEIGKNAFDGCSSLTSVVFGDSLTSIGVNILSNCSSLTSVVFGSGITYLTSYALGGCVALNNITIRSLSVSVSKNPFGDSESTYVGRNTYNTGANILYVPQGATGYDTGYWLDPLQNAEKCGFTISYIL